MTRLTATYSLLLCLSLYLAFSAAQPIVISNAAATSVSFVNQSLATYKFVLANFPFTAVRVNLTVTSGDADIYVSSKSTVSPVQSDFRSILSGRSAELILVPAGTASEIFIGVFGYFAGAGTLVVTEDARPAMALGISEPTISSTWFLGGSVPPVVSWSSVGAAPSDLVNVTLIAERAPDAVAAALAIGIPNNGSINVSGSALNGLTQGNYLVRVSLSNASGVVTAATSSFFPVYPAPQVVNMTNDSISVASFFVVTATLQTNGTAVPVRFDLVNASNLDSIVYTLFRATTLVTAVNSRLSQKVIVDPDVISLGTLPISVRLRVTQPAADGQFTAISFSSSAFTLTNLNTTGLIRLTPDVSFPTTVPFSTVDNYYFTVPRGNTFTITCTPSATQSDPDFTASFLDRLVAGAVNGSSSRAAGTIDILSGIAETTAAELYVFVAVLGYGTSDDGNPYSITITFSAPLTPSIFGIRVRSPWIAGTADPQLVTVRWGSAGFSEGSLVNVWIDFNRTSSGSLDLRVPVGSNLANSGSYEFDAQPILAARNVTSFNMFSYIVVSSVASPNVRTAIRFVIIMPLSVSLPAAGRVSDTISAVL